MPRDDMHLRSLTSLRFFAAMTVVLYHASFLSTPDLVQHYAVLRFGFLGVSFFFVLSGFVLVWSARDDDTIGAFYRRRFARVYPLHALTLVAAVGLGAAGWISYDGGAREGLLNAALVQAWSRDPATIYGFNGVSWSLSDEAFFYLMFPLIFAVARRLAPVFTIAIGFGTLVLGGVVAEAKDVGYLAGSLPIYRVAEFVIGVGLGVLLRRGTRIHLAPQLAVAGLALSYTSLVVINAATNGMLEPHGWLVSLGIAPVVVVVLWAYAERDLTGARGWLSHPLLVRAGQWSFALYMVHELVLKLCHPAMVDHLWAVPLAVCAAVAVSGAVYEWFERPVERRLRGRARPAVQLEPAGT